MDAVLPPHHLPTHRRGTNNPHPARQQAHRPLRHPRHLHRLRVELAATLALHLLHPRPRPGLMADAEYTQTRGAP